MKSGTKKLIAALGRRREHYLPVESRKSLARSMKRLRSSLGRGFRQNVKKNYGPPTGREFKGKWQ